MPGLEQQLQGNDQYRKENSRITKYEDMYQTLNSRKENAEFNAPPVLGYRHMNKRMLSMEQETMTPEDWETRHREHVERKLAIEAEWRSSNHDFYVQASREINQHPDPTAEGCYAQFDLAGLEKILKSHARKNIKNKDKQNSDEYDSVVTDLELYNMRKNTVDSQELFTLLNNLRESCGNYIHTKNPWFRPGKIRLAIIRQLQNKVNVLLEDARTEVNQRKEKDQNHDLLSEEDTRAVVENADLAFGKFSKIARKENYNRKETEFLNSACKANFELLSLYLKGQILLTNEELERFDSQMREILESLENAAVDDRQSISIETKFFNAIGWFSNKPTICDGFNKELKMYHTIRPGYKKDMACMVRQLTEGDRQYYSAKNTQNGGGFCLRASGGYFDGIENEEVKNENDELAMRDSWNEGMEKGSVQLTLALNEQARIIDDNQIGAEMLKLSRILPKTNRILAYKYYDHRRNIGVAFCGYNVIREAYSPEDPVEYRIADRSAISIDSTIKIRKTTDEEDFESIKLDEYLKPQKKSNLKVEKHLSEQEIQELKDQAKIAYEKFNKIKGEGAINKSFTKEDTEVFNSACKAHFELISLYLDGQISLTDGEAVRLDQCMGELLKSMKYAWVEFNQEDTYATKFFNAIGWSAHKPEICDDINAKLKVNDYGEKMFYTICSTDDDLSAEQRVRQQAGKGGFDCQYYADRKTNRGGLLALTASNKSWYRGRKKGSVQFTLTLSEHAHVIEDDEISKILSMFSKKFSVTSRVLGDDGINQFQDIYLAFMGYNVIMERNCKSKVNSFYINDRRALYMNDRIGIRLANQQGIEISYPDVEYRKLEDYLKNA